MVGEQVPYPVHTGHRRDTLSALSTEQDPNLAAPCGCHGPCDHGTGALADTTSVHTSEQSRIAPSVPKPLLTEALNYPWFKKLSAWKRLGELVGVYGKRGLWRVRQQVAQAAGIADPRQRAKLATRAVRHFEGWVKLPDVLVKVARDREAENVAACGDWQAVRVCAGCGFPARIGISSNCDHRLCPYCARARSSRAAKKVEALLPRFKHRPKFLTLTIRSLPNLDRGHISWLGACWRKLLRRKVMEDCQGGVRSVEVTWNPEGAKRSKRTGEVYNSEGGWHLHLHALVDMPFVPHAEIQAAWSELTGDPDGSWVDVRAVAVGQEHSAACEVAKYVAKGVELLAGGRAFGVERTGPELVDEFLKAVAGRRLIQPFGHLWGVGDLEAEEKEEPGPCPCCGCRAWLDLERWEEWRIRKVERAFFQRNPAVA